MQRKPIGHDLEIADQPTEAELKGLRDEGFVGVVNLRHDGEPEQPLRPADEGALVGGVGMDYLHVAVGGQPLTESTVGAVCNFLDAHAGQKVLVHCRKGGRAAALVLLHRARNEGWTAAEAIERGKALGLAVDGPLRVLVENYLADRAGAT